MRRLLLNLLTALSLLLCVAVVAAWAATAVGAYVRSPSRDYMIGWTTGEGDESTYHLKHHVVGVGRGELVVSREFLTYVNPYYQTLEHCRQNYEGVWPGDVTHGFGVMWHGPNDTVWNRLGFRRKHSPTRTDYEDQRGNRAPPANAYRSTAGRSSSYAVALWFLASVTGALPVARAIGRLRLGSRTRAGHCRACGYDLRATPVRCPECGRMLPAPPDA